MKYIYFLLSIVMFTAFSSATCPLDDIWIGINPSGDIEYTQDNNKLFFDATEKYLSTPSNWQNRYYLLPQTFFGDYRLGEPGVDVFRQGVHSPAGERNVDYRLMIKCLDISPDLLVRRGSTTVFSAQGDEFCLSCQSSDHIHFTYRVADAEAASKIQWFTFKVYDAFGVYEPSDPTTIVFCQPAMQGDIKVDGVIDEQDLIQFLDFWLYEGADKSNDFFERADINQDGIVDILDFSILASNWMIDYRTQ